MIFPECGDIVPFVQAAIVNEEGCTGNPYPECYKEERFESLNVSRKVFSPTRKGIKNEYRSLLTV
jgi:hypothetical protein